MGAVLADQNSPIGREEEGLDAGKIEEAMFEGWRVPSAGGAPQREDRRIPKYERG